MELLAPCVRDLTVNGKPCRALRDTAATVDIVHPSFVEPRQHTGKRAWIAQSNGAQKVGLPIAKVSIDGPFGVLETEAAVSSGLPVQYSYLFSNRSDQPLRDRGLVFDSGTELMRSNSSKLPAHPALKRAACSHETETGMAREATEEFVPQRV